MKAESEMSARKLEALRRASWLVWKQRSWPSGVVPEGMAYHCASAFGAAWQAALQALRAGGAA